MCVGGLPVNFGSSFKNGKAKSIVHIFLTIRPIQAGSEIWGGGGKGEGKARRGKREKEKSGPSFGLDFH